MYKYLAGLLIIFMTAGQMCLAKPVMLENGTKVRLKLADSVSSSINSLGDEVNFIVSDDVTRGRHVLVKSGSYAKGIIVELVKRSVLGKHARLGIELDYVVAVDGTKIPLRHLVNIYGDNRADQASFGISGSGAGYVHDNKAAFGIATFLPISWFVKGKNAVLPAGSPVRARVERDIVVEVKENL